MKTQIIKIKSHSLVGQDGSPIGKAHVTTRDGSIDIEIDNTPLLQKLMENCPIAYFEAVIVQSKITKLNKIDLQEPF